MYMSSTARQKRRSLPRGISSAYHDDLFFFAALGFRRCSGKVDPHTQVTIGIGNLEPTVP
jgi:hypothetical protein